MCKWINKMCYIDTLGNGTLKGKNNSYLKLIGYHGHYRNENKNISRLYRYFSVYITF